MRLKANDMIIVLGFVMREYAKEILKAEERLMRLELRERGRRILSEVKNLRRVCGIWF